MSVRKLEWGIKIGPYVQAGKRLLSIHQIDNNCHEIETDFKFDEFTNNPFGIPIFRVFIPPPLILIIWTLNIYITFSQPTIWEFCECTINRGTNGGHYCICFYIIKENAFMISSASAYYANFQLDKGIYWTSTKNLESNNHKRKKIIESKGISEHHGAEVDSSIVTSATPKPNQTNYDQSSFHKSQ